MVSQSSFMRPHSTTVSQLSGPLMMGAQRHQQQLVEPVRAGARPWVFQSVEDRAGGQVVAAAFSVLTGGPTIIDLKLSMMVMNSLCS